MNIFRTRHEHELWIELFLQLDKFLEDLLSDIIKFAHLIIKYNEILSRDAEFGSPVAMGCPFYCKNSPRGPKVARVNGRLCSRCINWNHAPQDSWDVVDHASNAAEQGGIISSWAAR